jgi:hypothetical protein
MAAQKDKELVISRTWCSFGKAIGRDRKWRVNRRVGGCHHYIEPSKGLPNLTTGVIQHDRRSEQLDEANFETAERHDRAVDDCSEGCGNCTTA